MGVKFFDSLFMFVAALTYLAINVIAIQKSSLAIQYTKIAGYIIPTLEILIINFLIAIANPIQSKYLIYFGAENLLYAIIIALSSLQGNKFHSIYTAAITAVSHFTLSWIAYDNFKKEFANAGVLFIYINYVEFFWFSFYYIIIGAILSKKAVEFDALNYDIEHLWIPKIIGGAYKDIMQPDGNYENEHYSIFSVTQMPEKYVGSDFFRIETMDNGDIAMIVGDITSHGLNVSQGALMALSVFISSESKNPRLVLNRINKVLYHVKKEHGGETLAIALILKPDGTVIYNGILDKIFVMRAKQNAAQIALETEGKLLGKNPDYDDIPENKEIKLDSGDNLVILTDGASNADMSDDRTSVIISYYNEPHI